MRRMICHSKYTYTHILSWWSWQNWIVTASRQQHIIAQNVLSLAEVWKSESGIQKEIRGQCAMHECWKDGNEVCFTRQAHPIS